MKLQRLLCDHKSEVGTYRILTILIADAGLGNVYFLEYTFVENPMNIWCGACPVWWMSYFTHDVVDVVYTIIYKLKCTKCIFFPFYDWTVQIEGSASKVCGRCLLYLSVDIYISG